MGLQSDELVMLHERESNAIHEAIEVLNPIRRIADPLHQQIKKTLLHRAIATILDSAAILFEETLHVVDAETRETIQSTDLSQTIINQCMKSEI